MARSARHVEMNDAFCFGGEVERVDGTRPMLVAGCWVLSGRRSGGCATEDERWIDQRCERDASDLACGGAEERSSRLTQIQLADQFIHGCFILPTRRPAC